MKEYKKSELKIIAKRKDDVILISKIFDMNYRNQFVKCICHRLVKKLNKLHSHYIGSFYNEYENLIDLKEFEEKFEIIKNN
jgi:hypothetical protein